MTQLPITTERSKNPTPLIARRRSLILSGKRLSGSRFVMATFPIWLLQKLFQIGHAFLVGKDLFPVFLTLFDLFLKFRQILFGDVPVDNLLPTGIRFIPLTSGCVVRCDSTYHSNTSSISSCCEIIFSLPTLSAFIILKDPVAIVFPVPPFFRSRRRTLRTSCLFLWKLPRERHKDLI